MLNNESYVFCLVEKNKRFEIVGAYQGYFRIFQDKLFGTNVLLNDFVNQMRDVINSTGSKLEQTSQIYQKSNMSSQSDEQIYWDWTFRRWPYYNLPQTIYINSTGARDEEGHTMPFVDIKTAITLSFQHWKDVPNSNHPFIIDPNQSSLISNPSDYQCVLSWQSLPEGAIARTRINHVNGSIVDVDIEFNKDDPWSFDGTTNTDDVENIATHEIGHFWGLADLYESYQDYLTMYGWSDWGETTKRSLEDGDIDGAFHMNPKFSGNVTGSFTIPSSQDNRSPYPEVVFNQTALQSGTTINILNYVTIIGTDNVAVNTNAVLNLTGCSTLFNPSKVLTIYGTLTAADVIFFSDQTWGGITFQGIGANNSIINNSQIMSVSTYGGSAVRIINSSPTIQFTSIYYNENSNGVYIGDNSCPNLTDNSINNNSISGIYVSNATGYIARNNIYSNARSGIECSYFGSPNLGKPGYYPGANNKIYANTYGINANSYSHPYVGSINVTWYQNNSLYNNLTNNLKAAWYSDILAELCWWGTTNPALFKISFDGTSPVSYTPYLSAPPQNGALSFLANTELRTDLQKAIDYRGNGNHVGAFNKLREMALNSLNENDVVYLLIELYNIYRESKNKEVFQLCLDLKHAAKKHSTLIDIILLKMKLLNGDYKDALNIADVLVASAVSQKFSCICFCS